MATASFAPLEAVAKLPDGVRENVLALQHLQEKYQDVFMKFLTERQTVENKYEKLYQPLYQKRREIVTGEREPTDDETKKGEEVAKKPDAEESKVEEIEDDADAKVEKEDDADVPKEDTDKGIPKFWLRALKNQEAVSGLIQDKDEPILEHLIDISCTTFGEEPELEKKEEPSNEKKEDDDESTGFTLTFEFSENLFFKNKTLTKTYYTKLDDEDGEELLVKAVGCTIEWQPNQNTTVKTKTKKQAKGQKTRVVKQDEPCESFFNFFKPPYANDEDLTKEIAEEMEDDFMTGTEIRKYVVPRAVSWYTGEAISMGLDGFG
eukprot:gene18661-28808_t